MCAQHSRDRAAPPRTFDERKNDTQRTVSVGLLHTKRAERAESGVDEAVRFACRYDSIVNVNRVLCGNKEFVAKLSNVSERGLFMTLFGMEENEGCGNGSMYERE